MTVGKIVLTLVAVASLPLTAPSLLFGQCCGPCGIACQTVCEARPVTSYRLVYDTVMQEREVTTFRPVWETQMRERRYRVAKPVCETSTREETYTVLRPVWETQMQDRSYDRVRYVTETEMREQRRTVCRPVTETQMREQRQVVRKQVCETQMQEQVRTVMQAVTTMRPQTVDQGCYQNQQVYMPGRSRYSLRWTPRTAYCDPITGRQLVEKPGLHWVPQNTGQVVTQRVWVPNLVTQQVPVTTMMPTQQRTQVPVQVTRYVDEEQVSQVPVQVTRYEQQEEVTQVPVQVCRRVVERVENMVPVKVCRYEEEQVVRKIPVQTCRYEYEERVEQVPVRVCRWQEVKQVVREPVCQPRWESYQSTHYVPRTVVMRAPVVVESPASDCCGGGVSGATYLAPANRNESSSGAATTSDSSAAEPAEQRPYLPRRESRREPTEAQKPVTDVADMEATGESVMKDQAAESAGTDASASEPAAGQGVSSEPQRRETQSPLKQFEHGNANGGGEPTQPAPPVPNDAEIGAPAKAAVETQSPVSPTPIPDLKGAAGSGRSHARDALDVDRVDREKVNQLLDELLKLRQHNGQ